MVDNVTEHIKNLETKIAVLSDKMDRQEKLLEKVVVIIEKQSVMSEQIANIKESLDIAHKKIRVIDEKGTNLCGGHIMQTKTIESRIDKMEMRAWQIWFAIFLQMIGLIIGYIKFHN
jgi:hypothetical protein